MDFKFEHIINEIVKHFPLTEDVLKLLKATAKVEYIKRKNFYVQKGEINRKVSFINKGLIKSFILDEYGQQHILSFFKEGEWVSDIHSHTFNEPCIATYQALEDTELITFEFESVERIKREMPGCLSILSMALQKKLAYLYEDRYRLVSLNAENRYKNFVQQNGEFLQRLSQKDIAAYLGILPESLSRIRRQLLSK